MTTLEMKMDDQSKQIYDGKMTTNGRKTEMLNFDIARVTDANQDSSLPFVCDTFEETKPDVELVNDYTISLR
uniref:Uncharacterized protein n=1 Tax=Romanomermis culicivorax TaxID=13658 RepID=A0A915HK95_ROMCU